MKHLRNLFVLAGMASAFLCGCTPSENTQDKEMDKFISELMDKMTLREKLGQLNLPAGGDLTTGAVQNSNLAEMIRKQELGGFFNVMSVEKIREYCCRRNPIGHPARSRSRCHSRLSNHLSYPAGFGM